MSRIAEFWATVERSLFPYLEECLLELPDSLRELSLVLELLRIEEHVRGTSRFWRGRPEASRRALARAFVAKACLNLPTTAALRERLQVDAQLCRLCGWRHRRQVPSAATFSRAFQEFAATRLNDQVHALLVTELVGETQFWHVSRDSTDIHGRERVTPVTTKPSPPALPVPAATDPAATAATDPAATDPAATADPTLGTTPAAAADPAATALPAPRRRGRPRKGEAAPPPEPTRLERQYAAPGDTAAELLAELPTACDRGTKTSSQGHKFWWRGYKLHVDVGDTGLPLLAVTTAASVHDTQVAIPMARLTAQRVRSFYALMDAGYDAALIRQTHVDLGQVCIIASNRRRLTKKPPLEPDRARRYGHRSQSERFNSDLKDNHGGNNVRVRGHSKVHAHLMFGVLVIFAKVLLGWSD